MPQCPSVTHWSTGCRNGQGREGAKGLLVGSGGRPARRKRAAPISPARIVRCLPELSKLLKACGGLGGLVGEEGAVPQSHPTTRPEGTRLRVPAGVPEITWSRNQTPVSWRVSPMRRKEMKERTGGENGRRGVGGSWGNVMRLRHYAVIRGRGGGSACRLWCRRSIV